MKPPHISRLVVGLLLISASCLMELRAQNQPSAGPTARLIPARTITLPGHSDSNSPAVWEMVDGLRHLFVFTSVAGEPTRHAGADLTRLAPVGPVAFHNHPGHGVWLEAVIPDVDGRWYGYYHHEAPAEVCDDLRVIPRIGAARSLDFGATWEDLGIILEAPPASYECSSANVYFVGGVGDFSVVLDRDHRYLYLFFSQYVQPEASQGVSVARLAWANRDAPAGKISVWLRNRLWLPARVQALDDPDSVRHRYLAGGPIYRAADGWHDDDVVDAFWGPSVHWNSHLEQYVMLLNRAKDASWAQEGIYVAYTRDLSEPTSWSAPQRLLAAGRWYPQVLGRESNGTDREAGEIARFFMSGQSEHLIQFSK